MAILIRDAEVEDAAQIAAIYRPFVEESRISFELTAPNGHEIGQRMAAIQQAGYPYLVAEEDGRILGYAYVSGFRARPAYHWTVEDSIYIAKDESGKGIGRMLLSMLIEECVRRGFRQMIAGIADDGVLSPASIAFHKALGFKEMGRLPDIGFKTGEWVDVLFLQRSLGEGAHTPPL